jgi:ABC-type nickel/cobalt efflux system permease component RcnA
MYCSACGAGVAQGLSFCSQCGAKARAVESDRIAKSSEMKPESLVWAMVAVLVFGFVAIVFLMMAMKMVGLREGPILSFTIMSFLIMLWLEAVFMWQLLRRKRSIENTAEGAVSREQQTKELDAAQARALPEPLPSVTEHTTRSFEPIYNERKSDRSV